MKFACLNLMWIILIFALAGCSILGGGGEEAPVAVPGKPQPTLSSLRPISSGGELMLLPGEVIEVNTPTPAAPSTMYDTVYLKKAELVAEKSTTHPVVRLQGNLPTPCHKLLIRMEKPDSRNVIQIKVFSSVSLNMSCCQVLQPFSQEVYLGDLPAGTYKIWVGSGVIGEVVIP